MECLNAGSILKSNIIGAMYALLMDYLDNDVKALMALSPPLGTSQ